MTIIIIVVVIYYIAPCAKCLIDHLTELSKGARLGETSNFNKAVWWIALYVYMIFTLYRSNFLSLIKVG